MNQSDTQHYRPLSYEDEYLMDDEGSLDDSDDYHQPLSITTTSSIQVTSTNGYYMNNNYGNPLAYTLHTIQEESEDDLRDSFKFCSNHHNNNNSILDDNHSHGEDDEPCSIHFSDNDSLPNDCDQFDDFQVAHNVINTGALLTESDLESESSDNLSQISDNQARDLVKDASSTLASSRLEKYFTSGLIGSDPYNYPADVKYDQDDDEEEEVEDVIEEEKEKKAKEKEDNKVKVNIKVELAQEEEKQTNGGNDQTSLHSEQSIEVGSFKDNNKEEETLCQSDIKCLQNVEEQLLDPYKHGVIQIHCINPANQHLNDWIQKQDFSPKENGSDISKDLSASSNTINTINTAISGTLSSSAASPFHGSSVKSNVDVDDLDVKVSLNRKDHITNHSTGNGVRTNSSSSVSSGPIGSSSRGGGCGRFGAVVVSGEICFSLQYNNEYETIQVHIKACKNLSAVDTKRNRSDPYVKIYLLPDHTKTGKRKTAIRKHTLNPVFDEKFKFNLPIDDVDKSILWISVWHKDIFKRNDFLGELSLPLSSDIFKNSDLRWYPLQDRILKAGIFIALKFVPSSKGYRKGGPIGKLMILVKEAYNLVPIKSNETCNPFCKCYLLPDRTKKQKTAVIKKSCDPKWNHTFEFEDISVDQLKERCLELTIWHYDKLTRNYFLGGIRLSLGQGKKQIDFADSSKEEVSLWRQMLDKTNMWVYGELNLRSLAQARNGTLR